MNEANTLVQEVTDLLLENGCTINAPAMFKLAIYIVEREKKVINKLSDFTPPNDPSGQKGE